MISQTMPSIGQCNNNNHNIGILFLTLVVSMVQEVTGQYFIKYSSSFFPGLDVCALDDVTVTNYRVTSLDDCVLLCQEMTSQNYRLGCLTFNYRAGQKLCELFVYVPNSYQPITGCVHYQQPDLAVIPPAYANIALKQTAYQSSLLNWGYLPAGLAVDGDTNSDLNSGHCSCTDVQSGVNSWWAVDLGSSYLVKWVNITNRGDHGANRLMDIGIIMTNVSPATYVGKPFIPQDRSFCAFHPGYPPGVAATVTVVCRKDVRPGRYLYIELPDPGYLALCEVSVYGDSVTSGK